ncbi:MAG: GHMP kinase [Candidatus Omnitrophica bacterium]|nr:GHMP kinase [Candidatus Omnitrophota bacterium]
MVTIFVPYRICPLGAHIDHQKGKVLGITIDKGTILKFEKIEGKVRMRSINFNEEIEFDINEISEKNGKWYDLLKGCVYVLKKYFNIKYGIEGEIFGQLPSGGIGSSASSGLSYLLSLEYVNNIKISEQENIFLFQKVENDYLGVKSGILDQSTILLSNDDKNSILYLDCKNLEYENIKSNKKFDYSIVMVYSGIERVLYETSYNKRVEECKNAGEKMFEFSKKKFSKEIFLRDIPKEIYIKYKDRLPENLRKRCQHFYDEMERVEKGIELWKKGDIEEFGKLIKASGESSIKNYECGAEELIKIFENLNSIEGVYGARFSGAGFRGWCFGFIKNDKKIKMNAKEILKNEYLKIYPQYASNFKVIFVDKKKELKFNLST